MWCGNRSIERVIHFNKKIHTGSIRFRLTAWYALVLVAALSLFGGLLWFSLRQSLFSELDRDLTSRAAQFEAYTIHEVAEGESAAQLRDELDEFCQALPPSSSLHLRGSAGFTFDYPAGPRSGNDRSQTLRRQFRAGAETFDLKLSASLRDIHHTLELVQFLLLSLLPVVIGAAVLGGAWLSRRALKPVDDVARAALATGIDNLSRRLPVPQTGDELQRLTEVWNTTLGRLESAVGTLSQFAADASHELRTPLSVIRTSAELALRRARTPEVYRESLGEIAAEAGRMTQLVEDLLFLARVDAQAAEMPKEPVDLKDLLGEVTQHLRGLAQVRHIQIRTLFPADKSVTVAANRSALRRLFLVLLDNAIKYSRAGGEVLVSVSGTSNEVIAAVEDFGCGIPAADQPHIFKRFYQADAARRDGGFGLGLSLAQSIAHAQGAVIDLESGEGVGSKFSVRFADTRLAEYPLKAASISYAQGIEGLRPGTGHRPASGSLRGTPSGFEASNTTLRG
jgi:signal transduction histidine kinase